MKKQIEKNIYNTPECKYIAISSEDIMSSSPLGTGLFALPNLDIE